MLPICVVSVNEVQSILPQDLVFGDAMNRQSLGQDSWL